MPDLGTAAKARLEIRERVAALTATFVAAREAASSSQEAHQRYLSARAALVEANIPLARHMVAGHPDAREVASAAVEVLFKAADRFDPTRGAHFATVACWWIRKAIRAAERSRGPMRSTEHATRTGQAPRVVDADTALERVHDEEVDPEQAVLAAEAEAERADRIARLRGALDTLDPQVRRIVLAAAAGEQLSAADRRRAAAGRRALAAALGVDPSLARPTHRGSAKPLVQGDLFPLRFVPEFTRFKTGDPNQ